MVGVRFSPRLYKLTTQGESGKTGDSGETSEKSECNVSKALIDLPYRMVFAVTTLDEVMVYDTQGGLISVFKNLHLASLTDLSWSSDGSRIVIASSDGYLSFVTFAEGELGVPLPEDELPAVMRIPAVEVVVPDDAAAASPTLSSSASSPSSSSPVVAASPVAPPSSSSPDKAADLSPNTVAAIESSSFGSKVPMVVVDGDAASSSSSIKSITSSSNPKRPASAASVSAANDEARAKKPKRIAPMLVQAMGQPSGGGGNGAL